MAKGTENHWTFRWLIVFPTQLFCSVCKIRLASPPYSPVLLLGLLISSLRVPFFLCGLAKVGGREACPCTCSNTTRFYSWFIPIYTTFFPRFQDTRRISTLLSIFFLIVCWDKKNPSPAQILLPWWVSPNVMIIPWNRWGIFQPLTNEDMMGKDMYLAYFLGEDMYCTIQL